MPTGWDVEILTKDGLDWMGLSLVPTFDRQGNPQPRTFRDILAASDADAPFSETLEADVQESWSKGVGLDYAWAPGVDTTDPDYACPAGAATDVSFPAGGGGGIAAIEEYGGDLWFAQGGDGGANTARVLRATGGVAPLSASLTIAGAGEFLRGMLTAKDGSTGASYLYAFSSDAGTANGRIHRWDGAAWTSTAAGTFGASGRGPAIRVTWRGRDGIKNDAIVTKSGPRQISYTKPNADPMLAASWVEGVPMGTAYELIQPAASRGHVFWSARDNLFDLDEVGNSPGITSYLEQQVRVGNGDAVLYLDGYVYYSTGDGLIMIRVDDAGVVQETPGYCPPGAYLPALDCPRGPVQALCSDMSWVVAAVFDGGSQTINVFYGKPAVTLGIESPNPMIWHGPLLRIGGNYRATAMRTSALAGLRLWVAGYNSGTATPRISWMSRPSAGSTKWDQATAGTHRVTTGAVGGTLQAVSRMYGLRRTAGDKASRKDLQAHVIGSDGLNQLNGTKLVLYNRADALPSGSWGTGTDIITGPVQTVLATGTTAGYSTEQRIDFFAPAGGSTPPEIPYLDSVRNTYSRIAPDLRVRPLDVVYGDALSIPNARSSSRDPDWITAKLQELIDNGTRTTLRTSDGDRYTVRLQQVLNRETTLNTGGPHRKSVRAGIRAVLIAQL